MRATSLLSAVSFLITLPLWLSGCSTKHQQVGGGSSYYPTPQRVIASAPAAGGSSGRYSAGEPARVDGSAAMHRATLRPYTVFGKRYYPQIAAVGSQEQGIASWYGPDFHGKKTSSGETYNMYAPGTAAHKTLPMNTIVLVTHRETGQQVKVRINDRGPFVAGRIIDLSYTAGKALGLDRSGIAPVTLKVLGYDSHIAAQVGGSRTQVAEAPAAPAAAPVTASVLPVAEAAVTVSGSYAIQLGSFKSSEGASRIKAQVGTQVSDRPVVIKTVEFGAERLHRVLIKGFESKEEAQRFKEERGLTTAVVVTAS